MGFVDHVYLGMRPWTRKNFIEFLNDVEDRIADSSPNASADQAQQIQHALEHELRLDMLAPCAGSTNHLRLESAYSVFRGMPMGAIASTTRGRIMEAYISASVWNHEVSFGKVDQWLGR